MKKIGILLVASTLVLSACGKRSDETNTAAVQGYDANGNPITAGGATPAVGAAIGQEWNVRVISSEPSVKTGGQETAEIKATITDANNIPVEGVDITFSTSGGVLQNRDAATNENGQATALLTLEYDFANQDIFVKAVAGNFEGSARVVATGSTLELSGDNNVVLGSDIQIQAKLTAGEGKPIANELVSISSRANNTLSATSATTDPEGIVNVTVGSANGDDTLVFSALNTKDGSPSVSQSYSFTVSDDQLKFADDAKTELSVNETHAFTVNWSFNGAPIVGKDLKFTITAGQIVQGASTKTDAAGNATVSVLSSIAGEVTVHAEAADGTVNNKHTFTFVGVTPAAIRVNSSSTRVNTRDNATVHALVQDANGNPVKDTMVIFSSANLKGGQLSTTSAETNKHGEVEITFTGGSAATNQDEIVIFAEVADTSINSSVSLTVVEPALNVTIGSSNKIEPIGNQTQYSIPYVVQVADGGGQALQGARVRISIEPVSYQKGSLTLVDSKSRTKLDVPDTETFSPKQWTDHSYYTKKCANEDVNGNRILDAGEDTNNNGSLDPQDPAVLMPVDESLGLATLESNGILTTDATGSGYFNLVFPATNAVWSNIRVVARAQALGVESEDFYRTVLLPLATEMTNVSNDPVNRYSPYGTVLDCTSVD